MLIGVLGLFLFGLIAIAMEPAQEGNENENSRL